MRVVGSLTTMPDQYFKLVETLKSLHNQTRKLDAIYLSLPKISRRLGTVYPKISKEISDLCTVVECEDYGPITKLIGGLLTEKDLSTVIITFDNDLIYPSSLVEKLLYYHEKYPNSAIGSSGMLLKYDCPMCAITPNEDNFIYRISKFHVPDEGRKIDSLYGYPGALYVRKFFPEKYLLESEFLNYSLLNINTLLNDDIMISGYLSMNNIDRRIFPNMPEVNYVLSNGVRKRNDSEISYNLDKFFQRMNLAIASAKSLGMYANTEPLDASETIIGVGAILIISIIILICICIYLIKYYYI